MRRLCPGHTSVFLSTPPEELERRLRRRGSEDEAAVRRRLETARAELARAGDYQYVIVNDDLTRATAELRELIAGLFEGAHNAG